MIVFIDTNLVLDVMLENSEFYDESVQHEVAKQIDVDLIITRNQADYTNSAVRVMSPAEFLSFAKV